jgi:REP element-mobilizing transposase RayT
VTICVKHRRNVLATPDVFEAIQTAIPQLGKWHMLAGTIMPDHVDWVVSPTWHRELSVGDFSHRFKRTLPKGLGSQRWEWQRGCFDRLLRSHENPWSNWIYVKHHPARHEFVHAAGEWPYYLDFISEFPGRGNCQLPLKFKGVRA